MVVEDLLATWRSIAALARSLRPDEWDRPTDLPGWSARDLLSHMASIEAFLLGRSESDHDAPEAPHVRNPLGAWNEQRVDLRRSWDVRDAVAEFEETTREREPVLRALSDTELATVSATILGEMTQERFLSIRLLDSWLHEQDIRRAVGRPETLDTPAAGAVLDMVLEWLPRAVAKAGMGDGAGAVIDITGPIARRAAAVVRGGRGTAVDSLPDATVTLRGEGGPFVRAATGRLAPAEAMASGGLQLSGDRALGERVLTTINRVP